MAAVTAADPSARAGAGERVAIDAPLPHEIPDGAKLADAMEACDWSTPSIGNTIILKAAVARLRLDATSASRSPAAGGVALGPDAKEVYRLRALMLDAHRKMIRFGWTFDGSDEAHRLMEDLERKHRDRWKDFARYLGIPLVDDEGDAAPASPAETKATLADATFDLAAPTQRVEAGVVAATDPSAAVILDGIANALESRGYVGFAFEGGIGSLLDELDGFRTEVRQAGAVAGDLGGVEAVRELRAIEAELVAIERQVKTTCQYDRDETTAKKTNPLATTVEISLSHVTDAVKRIRDRLDALRQAGAAGDGDAPWSLNDSTLAAFAAKIERWRITKAARDVLAERRRQIDAEGWTAEHDDEHQNKEISRAAACYCLAAEGMTNLPHDLWPWDDAWFKFTSHRGMLVKAGALILAEIERRDRADRSRISAEDRARGAQGREDR